MDISRPYSTLCPSLDGPVLAVLWHVTHPLTGRQIARLTQRGSEAGVRLVLRRLTEHGLVHAEDVGRAVTYTLNREHVAAAPLTLLMNLREELFNRVRDLIAAWTIQPLHASVFGSAARGDGRIESDIDLLLVRPDGVEAEDPAWRDQLHSLSLMLHSWSGNHPSLAEVQAEDLRVLEVRHAPMHQSLLRDAVTVAGPDYGRFLTARGIPLHRDPSVANR